MMNFQFDTFNYYRRFFLILLVFPRSSWRSKRDFLPGRFKRVAVRILLIRSFSDPAADSSVTRPLGELVVPLPQFLSGHLRSHHPPLPYTGIRSFSSLSCEPQRQFNSFSLLRSDAICLAMPTTFADVADAINSLPSSSDGPGAFYGFETSSPRRVRRARSQRVMKLGRSTNPRKRRVQWARQCRGEVHNWLPFYWEVPYYKKFGVFTS